MAMGEEDGLKLEKVVDYEIHNKVYEEKNGEEEVWVQIILGCMNEIQCELKNLHH